MTLSAPRESMLCAADVRPGDPPSRRLARIAGIFMVLTFISIPALFLYDPVLNHTGFVPAAGARGMSTPYPLGLVDRLDSL